VDNLTVVNGRDGLVEVGLGCEGIEHSLRQEWGISRDDCGGNRVEWDWQDG